ncbi:hypothetical protein DERP_008811 [Dermatophagoides pteronyssinus]|uniref:Uncharacterized protein n=1 Tax=Dermatophagoides pteronyssinus TaxID=6956 RepID=A0ABQ8IX17_DERPT|nr:hypothetical protein DERP_008811 [Dermatophagoides pteronyssinus]
MYRHEMNFSKYYFGTNKWNKRNKAEPLVHTFKNISHSLINVCPTNKKIVRLHPFCYGNL